MPEDIARYRGPERRGDNDRAAEEAADKAVRKVFAILGVDIDNPAQIEEFREDLRFSKMLRELARKGMFAAAGALGLLLIGAMGMGLIDKIKGFIK
ncbi:hypothetical protein G3T20_05285 [Bordetella hinzii]|uniref:hypothetical protein n=1 Tax=Bordetella hinzii TaxID=103855 RepID=UPI0013EFDEC7|nr:hypothetical protein [Bordetella hinzii]QII84165.1 hypothetical protein G3T20_05285 [Bordetella hinzii]